MTSLQIHKMFHWPQDVKGELNARQEENLAMKSMLLGMLFCAAFGPIVISQVDQTQWAFEFAWSMVGGTCGVVIFLCLPFECTDIRKMARVSAANFAASASLGPSLSWFVSRASGVPVNPGMLVAVGCGLGFMAATLIQSARPVWLKAWNSWNERRANDLGSND